MKTINLRIKTQNHYYNIVIGYNLLSKISKILIDNSINFKKCLLVVDKNIPSKIIIKLKKTFKKKKSLCSFF